VRQLQAQQAEQKQEAPQIAIEQPLEQKAEPEQGKRACSEIDNEERAFLWAANNSEKWLNKTSRSRRTWRELAQNIGDKVAIRGKLQKPRALLHIIEKTDKSAWNRMKAKAVLEMFPSQSSQQYANHYTHAIESGG